MGDRRWARWLLPAACALGGLVLIYAFRVGDEWGSSYAIHYGSFAPSRGELAFRLNLLTLVLPAALLLAVATGLTVGPRVLARFDGLQEIKARKLWAILGAAVVLASAALVREVALHEAATTDDENAYVFQAQLLAHGRTWVPSPPLEVRPYFNNQFIVNDGRRYGQYFLGHSLVLAALGRIGLDQMVGPIDAALAFLFCLAIATRSFGVRTAVLAGSLLATSPFFLSLSATQLSQPTSGLALAVFTYSMVRIEEEPRAGRWWALGAAGLSFAMLTRPQVTAAFALPLLAPLLWQSVRGRIKPGGVAIAAGGMVLACGAAAFLWANASRTGSPLRTAYRAYWDHAGYGPFPAGLRYSVRQFTEALGHLDFWLHGWPVSLVFVPFFCRKALALRLSASCALVALAGAAVGIPTVAHVGPVYYGELIIPLCILGASGIETVVNWLRSRAAPPWAGSVAALPVVMTAVALVTFAPVHLYWLERMGTLSRAAYDLADQRGLDNAVVFVSRMPATALPPGSWAYYPRNPDPDLRDPVLFVRDGGPEHNSQLLAYLRNRKGWILLQRNGRFELEPAGH